MALQLDLQTSNYGVPFAGAYFRVATAAISRQRSTGPVKFSVMIDIVGYATEPSNDDTKDIDFRRYHAPLTDIESQEGDTFLAKVYSWVALQPDMNSSIAV